jgi:hypothetical protein
MAIRGPPDPARSTPRKPYTPSARGRQEKKEEFTTENTEHTEKRQKRQQRKDGKPPPTLHQSILFSFVFFPCVPCFPW